MAVDEKISLLDTGIPIAGDFVPFVDDPGGTPVTKKFLWDQGIVDIAALAAGDGNFIVGDGSNWVAESGAPARASMGLGAGDSPTFTAVTATGPVSATASEATKAFVATCNESNNSSGWFNSFGTMTPGGGSPIGFRMVPQFNPSAAGLVLVGLNNNIRADGSEDIATLRAGAVRSFLNAGYSGTISLSQGLHIQNPSVLGGTLATYVGIDIDSLTTAATNRAIRTKAGLIVFNETGDADSDVRFEGDTDVNLFHTNTGADTVQVGAASASDSAKFYVSGKISCSGELEVNGDFNHDGSNFGALGAAPAAQQAHIVDADGTLADITTKFNTLLADLEGFGFLAVS